MKYLTTIAAALLIACSAPAAALTEFAHSTAPDENGHTVVLYVDMAPEGDTVCAGARAAQKNDASGAKVDDGCWATLDADTPDGFYVAALWHSNEDDIAFYAPSDFTVTYEEEESGKPAE